jgi:hypothetical protein
VDESMTNRANPMRFVWLDAYEGDGEWYDYGDYDAEDRLMVTYGFPFAFNRNYVSVASTQDPMDDNYACVINIPWGMLREVATVNLPAGDHRPEPIDVETLRRTIQNYQQQQD